MLGTLVKEGSLMLDDRARHLFQGIASLLDRFEQPLGGLDLPLQVLLGLGVLPLLAIGLDPVPADKDVRHPVVEQANGVFPFIGAFHDDVWDDAGSRAGRPDLSTPNISQ